MATIVNPANRDYGEGLLSVLLTIFFIGVLVVLFLVYAVPALQNANTNSAAPSSTFQIDSTVTTPTPSGSTGTNGSSSGNTSGSGSTSGSTTTY